LLGVKMDDILFSMRLIQQMDETVGAESGATATDAMPSSLARIVPVPEGSAILGVSQSEGGSVVGLRATGSVAAVSTAYVDAMREAGWELQSVDEMLGAAVFARPDQDYVAIVYCREMVAGVTSIVVQLQ
jgi:hypothetical protein